ncbi:hypothetical protein GWI33_018339 [Rhynchophorus ferrugineus]|uniref:Uncharacterized protein n=1 Tax=Rhynchophorus ferrugineus TaxID=354439 RepID=A0A834M5D7_RHYFE|nr:hypothetical protein GWI33_018339 [Rhynchophorus ferrugineus]
MADKEKGGRERLPGRRLEGPPPGRRADAPAAGRGTGWKLRNGHAGARPFAAPPPWQFGAVSAQWGRGAPASPFAMRSHVSKVGHRKARALSGHRAVPESALWANQHVFSIKCRNKLSGPAPGVARRDTRASPSGGRDRFCCYMFHVRFGCMSSAKERPGGGQNNSRLSIAATVAQIALSFRFISDGTLTVGGERFTVEPLRSCGPILECRRMGRPPPGVPPGDDAHDGAIRILGVIKVLSDNRLLGKALATLKKLLSGDEGDPPNHQPPRMPPATEAL